MLNIKLLMMLKSRTPTLPIYTIFLFLLYSCSIDAAQQAEDALILTIENNLKYSVLQTDGWFGSSSVKSRILLLPMNKELIDAAANYKCQKENLDTSRRRELFQSNYNKYLNSDITTFIMIIINKKLTTNELVYIPKISENLTLNTEKNYNLEFVDCTPSLKESLNSGWNAGYVYFKGQIPSSINSYSVQLHKVVYWEGNSKDSLDCSFTYDQTEMNYLSLIEKGLSKKEIEKKLTIKPYEESGIDEKEFFNIISFLYTAISKLS